VKISKKIVRRKDALSQIFSSKRMHLQAMSERTLLEATSYKGNATAYNASIGRKVEEWKEKEIEHFYKLMETQQHFGHILLSNDVQRELIQNSIDVGLIGKRRIEHIDYKSETFIRNYADYLVENRFEFEFEGATQQSSANKVALERLAADFLSFCTRN